LQTGSGERVAQLDDGGHQSRVDVWGQGAWQCPIELGNVGGEDLPPAGRLGPAPGGDVLEQVPQAEHGRLRDGR